VYQFSRILGDGDNLAHFFFLPGTGCGVDVAQNYNVPNIKKLVNRWMFVARTIEETYRKP